MDESMVSALAHDFLDVWRALTESEMAFARARQAVIDAAKAAGVTSRRVYVFGRQAIYVDPPGHTGEWVVSLGSPPETVEVQP